MERVTNTYYTIEMSEVIITKRSYTIRLSVECQVFSICEEDLSSSVDSGESDKM